MILAEKLMNFHVFCDKYPRRLKKKRIDVRPLRASLSEYIMVEGLASSSLVHNGVVRLWVSIDTAKAAVELRSPSQILRSISRRRAEKYSCVCREQSLFSSGRASSP